MKTINQKGFTSAVMLAILLTALALGTYLVQSKQLLVSSANSRAVVFKSIKGDPLPVDPTNQLPITKSLRVQVTLDAPNK